MRDASDRSLLIGFVVCCVLIVAAVIVACNADKALSNNKATVADKSTEAGRDVVTTDSKTSGILAGGLVACLGGLIYERRRATHAENGICRISKPIESRRPKKGKPMAEWTPREVGIESLVQEIATVTTETGRKPRRDPVEQVINRCVQRANKGAKT
jgi:hypothetical protein